MMRKDAIAAMLASKKTVRPKAKKRSRIRARGVVVRSTKVMITDRRDVPVVHVANR